jgi:uncharacterized membrane protein YczE
MPNSGQLGRNSFVTGFNRTFRVKVATMLWKLTVTVCLLCWLMPAADTAKPTADVLGRWVGGKWIADGKLVDSE